MAYHLYLCDVEFPEMVSSISIKIGGNNKTSKLLDGRTITFLQSPGLQEVGLSLPLQIYGAKRGSDYYINQVKKFFSKKKPTQLIVTRETPDGTPLTEVNIEMAISDMTTTEDADRPNEITLNVSLREYVEYGTETVQLKTVTVNGKTQKIAKVTKDRPNRNAPTASKYTVQENDTLWGIAAKYLGSSSQYKALFNANKDNVSDPNVLKPGTVLTIPQK